MDGILGQERAIDTLQAALTSGRLHHAWIFHGPAGVGKRTTALAFARMLLCHARGTDLAGRPVACGACPSCDILRPGETPSDEQATAHPDLHLVNKELARFSQDKTIRDRKLITIPVDVLNSALIEPVYRSAQWRHGKVFIVDEAELITPIGQNKLLKTLEEPPAQTFIILVTSNEDRLLPTIRSRCQRVAFAPLGDEVLVRYLDQQSLDLTPQQRQWLLRFTDGSLGRLQLAIQHNLFAWATTVLPGLEQMARGQYPVELGKAMAGLIDEFAETWVKEHKNASKEAANKMAAGLMWALISQHARQRLAEAAATGGSDLAAAEVKAVPWLGVIDGLMEAERDLAANVNMSLVADRLVAALARTLSVAPGTR